MNIEKRNASIPTIPNRENLINFVFGLVQDGTAPSLYLEKILKGEFEIEYDESGKPAILKVIDKDEQGKKKIIFLENLKGWLDTSPIKPVGSVRVSKLSDLGIGTGSRHKK